MCNFFVVSQQSSVEFFQLQICHNNLSLKTIMCDIEFFPNRRQNTFNKKKKNNNHIPYTNTLPNAHVPKTPHNINSKSAAPRTTNRISQSPSRKARPIQEPPISHQNHPLPSHLELVAWQPSSGHAVPPHVYIEKIEKCLVSTTKGLTPPPPRAITTKTRRVLAGRSTSNHHQCV